MGYYLPPTAVSTLLGLVMVMLLPLSGAEDFVLAPEGGRVDAMDETGQQIGPAPLKHTDVDVRISGHFTRVNVTQHYENPYDQKIEAVYTFPLSHRGAVGRMTMITGDPVVEGEVKQRDQAQRIYEAARRDGHVTSLLEQERPRGAFVIGRIGVNRLEELAMLEPVRRIERVR